MPPKRQPPPSTPPSSKKQMKKSTIAQTSIDSFFASPSKPKFNGTPKKRHRSVISFIDSDDEQCQRENPVNGDEELARKLATDWAAGDAERVGKGKDRAASHEPDGEEDDILAINAAYPDAPGVNDSSSSNHQFPPVKYEQKPSLERDVKPLASIFSKQNTPPPSETKPNNQSPVTSSNASAIIATPAEAVDVINFDVDAFLFHPSEVDVSKWPKGRLPYSVLVGVYVQVSSTRSRLTIVRVLTK